MRKTTRNCIRMAVVLIVAGFFGWLCWLRPYMADVRGCGQIQDKRYTASVEAMENIRGRLKQIQGKLKTPKYREEAAERLGWIQSSLWFMGDLEIRGHRLESYQVSHQVEVFGNEFRGALREFVDDGATVEEQWNRAVQASEWLREQKAQYSAFNSWAFGPAGCDDLQYYRHWKKYYAH